MDSPVAARTSRVRTLVAQRPSQIVLVSVLLLLFIAAWFAASRAAFTQARSTSTTDLSEIAAVPFQDDRMQPWIIPAPAPEVRVTPRPVPTVDPTDWSALSLGVSGVAPVATLATANARPAELANSMSEAERRMVLASVKSGEPEGLPSPQGYTPGIVVLVPGGASSDGICR